MQSRSVSEYTAAVAYAQFTASPHYANGDFAAVRYQYFREHPATSLHRQSAVNHQDLASNVRGQIARQKGYDSGHVGQARPSFPSGSFS